MAFPAGGSISVAIDIQPGGIVAEEFGLGLFLHRVTSAVTDRAEAEQLRGVQRYVDAAAMSAANVPTLVEDAGEVWFGQSRFPKNLLVATNIAAAQASFVFGDPDGTGTVTEIEALGDNTALSINGSAFTADFDTLTTFAAIATALQTGIRTVTAYNTATVSYDASGGYFAVTHATAGFGAGFADSSAAQTLGLSGAGVSILDPVATVETPSDSLSRAEGLANWFWTGLDPAIAADFALLDAARDWVGARRLSKSLIADFFGTDVLVANETTSIGARIAAQGGDGIAGIYNGRQQTDIDHKGLSYAARFSAVDYSQPRSQINGKFLPLPGTAPTDLTQAQKTELDRKRINFYQPIRGTVLGETAEGKSFGTWLDVHTALSWIYNQMQAAGASALRRSGGLDLTNDGLSAAAAAVEGVCEDAVQAGILAPGTVSASLRSDIIAASGNADFDGFLSTGYLIIRPSAADISQTVRDARGPIPIRGFIKGSGRINFLSISLTFEN